MAIDLDAPFLACLDSGLHLVSCDSDGYCNSCGRQEQRFSIVITGTVIAFSEDEAEDALVTMSPAELVEKAGVTLLRGTVHDDGGELAAQLNQEA